MLPCVVRLAMAVGSLGSFVGRFNDCFVDCHVFCKANLHRGDQVLRLRLLESLSTVVSIRKASVERVKQVVDADSNVVGKRPPTLALNAFLRWFRCDQMPVAAVVVVLF